MGDKKLENFDQENRTFTSPGRRKKKVSSNSSRNVLRMLNCGFSTPIHQNQTNFNLSFIQNSQFYQKMKLCGCFFCFFSKVSTVSSGSSGFFHPFSGRYLQVNVATKVFLAVFLVMLQQKKKEISVKEKAFLIEGRRSWDSAGQGVHRTGNHRQPPGPGLTVLLRTWSLADLKNLKLFSFKKFK